MSHKISVVVPTHNERENIPELYRRVRDVFDKLDDADFELIFCDDSSDETPAIAAALHQEDPRVKLIRLSRRYSQSIAISAGLDHCSGDAAILMDADLQDPPEAVPLLLEKWKEGCEVVWVRRPSEGGRLYRNLAFLFYRLLARLSSTSVPVDAGEFRLLDRKIVNILSSLPEHTRYLRELTVWPGFRQSCIDIERSPRGRGTTKYNFWRSLIVAVDGIISASIIPLRAAVFAGVAISTFSFFTGLVYLVWKLIRPQMLGVGWTSLFLTLMFMGGVQLIFLGIIGEYLGRIFIEVQARPLYLIDYSLGLPEEGPPPLAAGGRPARRRPADIFAIR
jgi:glycosyltransferase involved in cell wall biosynthesis